jgi:hypothetical protein
LIPVEIVLPPPPPPTPVVGVDGFTISTTAVDCVRGCCDAREAHAQEALVIAEIEIGLAAVVEDVSLAVLEGAMVPASTFRY